MDKLPLEEGLVQTLLLLPPFQHAVLPITYFAIVVDLLEVTGLVVEVLEWLAHMVLEEMGKEEMGCTRQLLEETPMFSPHSLGAHTPALLHLPLVIITLLAAVEEEHGMLELVLFLEDSVAAVVGHIIQGQCLDQVVMVSTTLAVEEEEEDMVVLLDIMEALVLS